MKNVILNYDEREGKTIDDYAIVKGEKKKVLSITLEDRVIWKNAREADKAVFTSLQSFFPLVHLCFDSLDSFEAEMKRFLGSALELYIKAEKNREANLLNNKDGRV